MGKNPETGLTVGPDGALYGVTLNGGTGGDGTAFRVSLTGEFTLLDNFQTETTGEHPVARLVNIGDGNLYGVTTANENIAGKPAGTVYALNPSSGLSVLFPLYRPVIEGPFPRAPRSLTSGEPGVLHVLGSEPGGLWRVPISGGGAVARYFSSTLNEGNYADNITRGPDGYLYGGSWTGGANGQGILFRIAPDGSGMTKLHDCAFLTGMKPMGQMVVAQDGNLYGTMEDGGPNRENGVIFRLTPAGEYSVVHEFTDFSYPKGGLLLATDGMLYGIGQSVGPGGNGNGGVYRIKTNGTGYKVLHVFKTASVVPFYPTGAQPKGGLVQAADGHLYGTTSKGGADNEGTVFRIKLNLPPPAVNRAPLAVNDVAVTIDEAVAVNVLANDFDPDRDALTVTITAAPNHGTAEVQPGGAILYTPNGTYAGADAFVYEVNDLRGGKSSALVQITDTAPPALFAPGGYNGLVSLDENLDGANPLPRGQFQLTVKATGVFTGTLFTKKKRISLKGKFVDGRATTKVKLPDRKVADVFFTFQAGSPSTILAAFYGNEIWTGDAGPVRGSGDPKKQSYTVQIAANSAIASGPIGHGYGTLTLKPSGAVSVIGKLGDGSSLKWSTSLTELPTASRVIPAYSEPLKDGIISGLLVGSNTPGEDFTGTLKWSRPPAKKITQPYVLGFNGEVDATVARFTPPGPTAPVLEILSAGVKLEGIGFGPISGGFTVDGKKIQPAPASQLRSLTINRATGIFSGTMRDGSKTISFKGAVNQGLNSGFGYFIRGGETGSAEFVF